MVSVMAYVITAMLALLVFTALLPTIADQFIGHNRTGDPTGADPQGNMSGATGVMAALVPVILLIALVWRLWKYSGTK